MKRKPIAAIVLAALIAVLVGVGPVAEAKGSRDGKDKSESVDRKAKKDKAKAKAKSKAKSKRGKTPPTTTAPTTSTTLPTTTTTVPAPTTTTTTAPPAQPAAPPLPVTGRHLTKLRFTIDSTSEWATIDLRGGSFYAEGAPTVTGGTGGPYSTTGFSIQTSGAARLVADVVYELPSGPLNVEVCKNNNGVTSVRIERITDAPTSVVQVSDTRADGVWEGRCANAARKSVTPAALAPSYSWPRPVDDRNLTLALYTPWYDPPMFAHNPFVDRPAGAYDCADPASISAMIASAAGAGVNGFLYWHNGEAESVRRYDMVMTAAEGRPGFSVAAQLDLGMAGGFDRGTVTAKDAEAWARTLLARSSSPSYLRVGDRPVLFVWGTQWLTPQAWGAVRASLAATGLNPFVLGDSHDAAYGFDGFWLLNANEVPDSTSLTSWYDWWAREARLTPARGLGSAPMLWAAGISPGEDDTYSGKRAWQWLQIPRNGGSRYDQVWQAASAAKPEWMVISTWNDFHEATYIMPSERFGTRALDQTRSWTTWFSRLP